MKPNNQLFDDNLHAIAEAIANGILTTIREGEAEQPEYYQIQTGSLPHPFTGRTAAENTLRSQGFPAFIVSEDGLFKVRAGAFRTG